MVQRRNRNPIGIENSPTDITANPLTREGEIATDSSDNELKVRLDSATRTVVTEDQTQTLTNKTIDVDNNTVSNIEVDNLKSGVLNTSTTLTTASDTQVPSALAVKTYVDNSTSTIADKVSGPASSTDNAIARFDLATGKLIQNSVVTVSDTGVVVGATVDADTNTITNIENADIKAGAAIARNKLASGTNNAVVHNNASGVQTDSADLLVGTNALILQNTKHLEVQSATDSTTTGTAATLTAFTAGTIRLTNVSLVSIATIPAGANGQKLTLINRTGNAITILTSGNILLGTSTTAILENNGAFSFDNDSTSAKWQLSSGAGSSSSGMGGINYITNFNAEIDTTGWTTYADAAGTAPVDGTGNVNSPTPVAVTLTRSTSSPLRGTASFLYTKPASNVQGQGFSYDFTIDSADTGKVLQGSFDYQIASGTFADNDLSVWIYDVTNAVMIQPAPYLLKNSGIIERFPVEFQTAINSTSYRLIIHQGSTSAVAATLKFDNFNFGPQAKLYGSPVLDGKPYTATLTNLGNATQALSYQRIGNTVRITGTIIIGATLPTSTITFSLPLGMSADYSSVPKGIVNTDSYQAVGYATSYPGGATGRIQRAASSLTDFVIGYTSGAVWNATTPATWSAGQSFTLDLVVPIQGWSSSQVMSNDADTRVVSASVFRTAAQSAQNFTSGSAQKIQMAGIYEDTHGAYDGVTNFRYTIKVPGSYRFSPNIGLYTFGANGSANILLYKNGTPIKTSLVSLLTAATQTSANPVFKDVAKAGDYYEIFISPTTTVSMYSAATITGGSSWGIEMLSGPAQIAASESVSALYTGAPVTGSLSGTRSTATFGTKVKDSHNTYISGIYTVPSSGVYDISAQVNITGTHVLNGNTQIAIAIDGTTTYINALIAGGAITELTPSINIKSVPLRAGQTITIQAASTATTPAYTSDARQNFFSVTRSGNF